MFQNKVRDDDKLVMSRLISGQEKAHLQKEKNGCAETFNPTVTRRVRSHPEPSEQMIKFHLTGKEEPFLKVSEPSLVLTCNKKIIINHASDVVQMFLFTRR